MVVFAPQCVEKTQAPGVFAYESGAGVGFILGGKDLALKPNDPGYGSGEFGTLELPDHPTYLVSYQPYELGIGLEASIEHAPTDVPPREVQADATNESGNREVPLGPWMEQVTTRFVELLSLGAGWDSHGGRPIDPANVREAGRFLAAVMDPLTPAPVIVPTSGGGLQLEWHRAGLDVELLFEEEDSPELYVADISSGNEWEGSPVEGFAEFELAQRLIG